jgi:hypothetical protein
LRCGATLVWALALAGMAWCGPPKPDDVNGWDKINWGMTMAQVRSAYGVEAQPGNQGEWTLLDLPSVKIADVELGVQVGARRPSEKITSVRLWSFFGLANSPPTAGSQNFDTLRTALIQRYGQPDKEETKRGENFRLMKSVLWTFPSTSILLTLEQSDSLPNLGNIYLNYTANH